MMDWEERWRSGETPWDHGAPAPPLIELLASDQGPKLKQKRVLVPGCGSGQDVRELARAGAIATGLDLSPTAIEHASRQDPTTGANFVCGSFFDWSAEPFEAIWEHTCFCAIELEDRIRYAEASARLIVPGGHLAGVFYLEPWPAGEVPKPPPYASDREEIVRLLSPEFVLRWEKVPDFCYPGREEREWLAVFERVMDRGVADCASGG